LAEEDVRGLMIGQQVDITGIVHVARDLAHKRMVEHLETGQDLPVALCGAIIFHAGPTVTKAKGTYEIINIGPTTSARMNPNGPAVISRGVRAVVGKGSMDAATHLSMKEHGCVFLAAPSGCAMIHAACVKEVVDVHWLDLGTTEAVWVIRVENWGPLTVAMDAKGGNLFADVRRNAETRMERMMRSLSDGVARELDTTLLWD
jgi:fumarate hydratase subunit beta